MNEPCREELWPGEDADLYQELKDLVPDVDAWLEQPNSQLGGKKPKELLGSPETERELRNLVRAVRYGQFT